MSVETIAVVISAASLLLALAAGFAWMIRRTDAQFERVDARFDAQRERTDAQFERHTERLAAIERELVEVKIAIARMEGPERRLVAAR